MRKSLTWKDSKCFFDLGKKKRYSNGIFRFVLLIQNTPFQEEMLSLDFPNKNSVFFMEHVNYEETTSVNK